MKQHSFSFFLNFFRSQSRRQIFVSRPAAHLDGVQLSGRPALKERETRLMREKWSQDNVLIKAQMFNGECTYKGGRGGPILPIHPWIPAAGDYMQDRV